jgi:hypothetical protein
MQTAQVQRLGDPTQRHRRPGPPPVRQLHLAFIPFGAAWQFIFHSSRRWGLKTIPDGD